MRRAAAAVALRGALRRHDASALEKLLASLATADTKGRSKKGAPQAAPAGGVAPKVFAKRPRGTAPPPAVAATPPPPPPPSEQPPAAPAPAPVAAAVARPRLEKKEAHLAAEHGALADIEPAVAAAFVPSPAAALALSSAEAIQEGSPQHFVAEPEPAGEPRPRPRPILATPGHVAFASIVARVTGPCPAGAALQRDGDNGVFAPLGLTYEVPFAAGTASVRVEARCYGDVLARFCSRVVREGDVVHVHGHLLPLTATLSDGTAPSPLFAVCVLPLGGNICVVTPAAAAAAAVESAPK